MFAILAGKIPFLNSLHLLAEWSEQFFTFYADLTKETILTVMA